MKIKSKEEIASERNRATKLTKMGKVVSIHHSQSIKLSANWQSAGCTYGVTVEVEDDDEAIQAGIARAEELVESPLVAKIEQQKELLANLGQ